ncbi:MAG: hydrogenase maturation protease [Chloroflexaceae bacterium]
MDWSAYTSHLDTRSASVIDWSMRAAGCMTTPAKTLVLGLGNPILTDDGVGVQVAEAVAARLPLDSPVDCIEVSVGGLMLMEAILGYERVILIDALYPATQPGRIHQMTLADLRAMSVTEHSNSPHDAGLITALDMAQRMGLPLPAEITIYAVEVENIIDFGDTMTAAVAAAVPRVTEAVLAELFQSEVSSL